MVREHCYNPRRGISVLWMIVTLPIFMFLFMGVVMIGNIWLGRVELENALEAAALAAVKDWAEMPGPGSDTFVPRNVGVAYAAANTIAGVPVDIRNNYDDANGGVNQNLLCSPIKPDPDAGTPPGGNLIFGAVIIANPGAPNEQITFNAGIEPSCGPGKVISFGVRAQAVAPVASPVCWIYGLTDSLHYVTVTTTAMYDCVTGRPRLIRVDEYICPGP